MSDQTPNVEATGKPTPLAGCTIFLVIIGMVIFLAIFATYQYREYKAEIVNISQEQQKKIPLAPTDDKSSLDALTTKLQTFSAQVKEGKKTKASFTPAEINLAIAHYEKLKAFRNQMHIVSIKGSTNPDQPNGHILAEIAFPVRAGFDGIRHLNGTMKMNPVMAKGAIFPVVTEITPDTGNPVPPKFTKEFPTFLFNGYFKDKDLEPVFHKLSKVELRDNEMIIISDPAITQPDAIPEDVSYEENRFFSIIGLLTFIFITTLAFVIWVKKRNKTPNP